MKFYLLVLFVVSSLFSQQYPERISHRKSNFPYPKSKINSPGQFRQPGEHHSQYPPGEEWREFPQPKQVTGNDATWEVHITGEKGYSTARTIDVVSDSLGNVYQIVEFLDPLEGYKLKIAVVKYSSTGTRLWEKTIKNNINDAQLSRLSMSRVLDDQSLHMVYTEELAQDEESPGFFFDFYSIKFSSEGDIQYNRKLNSQKMNYIDKNVLLNSIGDCYFLRYNYPEESSEKKWILEKIDTSGVVTHSYMSGNLTFGITQLMANRDELPVVKRATIISLRFYQFDDTLSLKWYYTNSITNEYSFPEFVIQISSYFDSNNNLYFFDERIYPEYIVKIDDEGNMVKQFPLISTNYNNSAGINSNDNIFTFSVADDQLYIDIYDTSGNIINQQIHDDELLYPWYIYETNSGSTGSIAIDRHVFDSIGQLKLTAEGLMSFTGNGLFEKGKNGLIRSFNDNYSVDWSANWPGPLSYNFSSFKNAFDDNGNTYTIGIQELETGTEVGFSRIDANGNSVLQKKLKAGWDKFQVIQFDRVENNRYICFLKAWNITDNTDKNATIVLILNENGSILNEMTYPWGARFETYSPYYNPIYAAKKGSYYYFTEWFFEHDYANDKHTTILKFTIFDRQGNRVANNFKEYTYGEDDNLSISTTGFVIDAEGSFHVFTRHHYYTSADFDSGLRLRIYKLTLDNQLTFIDNHSFYDNSASFVFGHGKEDNWGNFIFKLYGNSNDAYIAKLSTNGELIWQTDLGWEGVYYHLTIVPDTPNGKILVFASKYNSDYTLYYLLSRDGVIEVEKTLPEYFYGQDYQIQGENIVFANDGAIRIFDTKLHEFIEKQEQADIYGRYFELQDLFANPEGSVFLSGTRDPQNHYVGDFPAHLIRFDTDVLDLDLENQPRQLLLNGNFPNPFNSQTAIRIFLPETGNMEIDVYNSLGQRVDQYSAFMPAGNQVYYFKNSVLSSGTYFYLVRQNGRKATGKFVYVK